jgi:hypothetical protein
VTVEPTPSLHVIAATGKVETVTGATKNEQNKMRDRNRGDFNTQQLPDKYKKTNGYPSFKLNCSMRVSLSTWSPLLSYYGLSYYNLAFYQVSPITVYPITILPFCQVSYITVSPITVSHFVWSLLLRRAFSGRCFHVLRWSPLPSWKFIPAIQAIAIYLPWNSQIS